LDGLVGVETFAPNNRLLTEFMLKDAIQKNVARMVGTPARDGAANDDDDEDDNTGNLGPPPFGVCYFCRREQGYCTSCINDPAALNAAMQARPSINGCARLLGPTHTSNNAQFVCYACYRSAFLGVVDAATRARELTHGDRVRRIQDFTENRKQASLEATAQRKETQGLDAEKEATVAQTLRDLGFLAATKKVRWEG
jgi:hypothetical protein